MRERRTATRIERSEIVRLRERVDALEERHVRILASLWIGGCLGVLAGCFWVVASR